MDDFDREVINIGRQRAIAFFAPRLIGLAILVISAFIALR